MKNITTVLLIACLAFFAGCAFPSEPYQYKETRELVALVDSAAALVEKEGEKAFVQFNADGTRWRQGNKYVLVYDYDKQVRLVYPPHPEKIGEKMSAIIDPDGRPIGNWLTKEGWIFYRWPQPKSAIAVWKAAFTRYAAAPSGKKYIVSSGIYDFKMEKVFISDLVNEAADLVTQKGRAAFPVFYDKSNRFLFGDFYIFVTLDNGVELVNPVSRKIEGKNLWDTKDASGKYFVKEYIELAKASGAGWVSYMWPKPKESAPSLKHAYVRAVKHGGETFIVGAGIY